jgi:HlyD family type I secretion membrane fusion protein
MNKLHLPWPPAAFTQGEAVSSAADEPVVSEQDESAAAAPDESEDQTFDSTPALARGWMFVGVLVGTFGAWGTTAELASTVIAPGTFVVESARKPVQHLEGGIVSEVFVGDGDIVRGGEPLVQLNTTAIVASLKVVQDQFDANVAERARLMAIRDERPEVVFPQSLVERGGEARVAEILRLQRTLFDSERKARDGQIDLLEKKVEITGEQIAGLRAQKASKEEQRRIIRKEYAGLKTLFDKGLTPQTTVLALERNAVELSGEIGSAVAEIARAEKEIGETELEIVQLKNGYVFELNDQIKTLDIKIAELGERQTELKDILRRTTVVSPANGRVLNLAVTSSGEVLAPGSKILEIVPVADHLVIQAKVRPQDIEQVFVGQPAKIRLSAFDQKYTPSVEGAVSYVSADILVEERTGLSYYDVKITVPDEQQIDVGALGITAGMPADTFILSESRTMLDYLSRPVVSALHKAMRER